PPRRVETEEAPAHAHREVAHNEHVAAEGLHEEAQDPLVRHPEEAGEVVGEEGEPRQLAGDRRSEERRHDHRPGGRRAAGRPRHRSPRRASGSGRSSAPSRSPRRYSTLSANCPWRHARSTSRGSETSASTRGRTTRASARRTRAAVPRGGSRSTSWRSTKYSRANVRQLQSPMRMRGPSSIRTAVHSSGTSRRTARANARRSRGLAYVRSRRQALRTPR